MRFEEAITTLMQRPGQIAILGTKIAVRLSDGGRILDCKRARETPVTLRAADVLAVTWECWTPQQLDALQKEAEAG